MLHSVAAFDHIEDLVRRRITELTCAKERAEAANRAKSNFLTRTSHDLRAPLHAVLGFAQLLKCDDNLTEVQRRWVNVIEHSGRHLLTLIDDILDLSKVEAGKLELVPETVDLIAFLRIVDDMIRVKAEEKGGLVFRCCAPPELPCSVQVDAKRLRQVLLNLLCNAVNFTDSGEVSLQVQLLWQQAGRAGLRFAVNDSGVGIAPDELDSVFMPFQQGGDPKRRVCGTGLGLAISRQIVCLMGGELRVESHVGSGSRFWFDLELPLAETSRD